MRTLEDDISSQPIDTDDHLVVSHHHDNSVPAWNNLISLSRPSSPSSESDLNNSRDSPPPSLLSSASTFIATPPPLNAAAEGILTVPGPTSTIEDGAARTDRVLDINIDPRLLAGGGISDSGQSVLSAMYLTVH